VTFGALLPAVRGMTPARVRTRRIVGTVAALLMIVVSPFAAALYSEPQLIALVSILSWRAPLEALGIPAAAYLACKFHFRTLAVVSGMQVVTAAVLSVCFALAGMGAYSFVLPLPIASALGATGMWLMARPNVRWAGSVRRMRFLLRDSTSLTFANVMRGMTNRTGYFALGVFHTAPVVGIFFFAYNLSSQTLRIVTFSLSRVMMPIFAHLNDEPRRQLRGCLRASESLVALGLVFCLLQAAVAEPLFRLVFGPKWDAAVPVFQFLCIGLAMRMPEATALSLLKGRGEFRRFYWLCQISFLVFLSAALLTAWLGGPRLVAHHAGLCSEPPELPTRPPPTFDA